MIGNELSQYDISLIRNAQPSESVYKIGKEIFDQKIAPFLEPPRTFQYANLRELKNLQSGLFLKDRRAWLPIPKGLPPVFLSEKNRGKGVDVFFLDDLILSHYPEAVIGMLRLTRDADFSVELEEENQEDLPEIVRTGLKKRDKGKPVRLQYLGHFTDRFFTTALKRLRLSTGQLMAAPGSFYFAGFWTLFSKVPSRILQKFPELKHSKFTTEIPEIFKNFKPKENIFQRIEKKDILLHHPYDSFDALIGLVDAAASDPFVVSIEMTIYRTDVDSKMIAILKRAAKRKKVKVAIELRARFDEFNNLKLSEELKSAGCEVHFGFGKLKLHAKMILITRKTKDGKLKRFTHLSTGNYNAATARVYTDLALITARKEIGNDARKFFDAVYEEKIATGFKVLLSAPNRLHRRLIELIKKEAEAARRGEAARIVVKVNALVDEEVVEELYSASSAGVKIDLIIRGACSLVPGIQGVSENIRVVSVVDHFLEHSRLYYFGYSKKLYLSSADWMPRNFFSRLELAFPLMDEDLIRYIEDFFIPLYLMDTEKARELTPLGTWKKRTMQTVKREVPEHLKFLLDEVPARAQFLFEYLAGEDYIGTPLNG